jgi:hypothetical protein
MAITLEQTVTGSDASASSFTLSSWTPLSDELVILCVAQRDEANAVTASGNGLTFVSVVDVDNVQGQNGISILRAQISGTPTTGQITVTMTGNGDPAFAVAMRFSGVATGGTNGSEAVEASASDTGPDPDDTDMLASVTTVTANAWALAAGTHRLSTFTVPGGETGISINNSAGAGGNLTSLSVWYQTVASAGATQLGDTGDLFPAYDWTMGLISIKPGGLSVSLASGSVALTSPTITIDAPTGTQVALGAGTLASSTGGITVVPGSTSVGIGAGSAAAISSPGITVYAPILDDPSIANVLVRDRRHLLVTWHWGDI